MNNGAREYFYHQKHIFEGQTDIAKGAGKSLNNSRKNQSFHARKILRSKSSRKTRLDIVFASPPREGSKKTAKSLRSMFSILSERRTWKKWWKNRSSLSDLEHCELSDSFNSSELEKVTWCDECKVPKV
jgi:hypothetical protein